MSSPIFWRPSPAIAAPFLVHLTLFEVISVAIFSIEYAWRLWTSVEEPAFQFRWDPRGPIEAALHPLMVIDFLAFAPGYVSLFVPFIDLRFLRMIRLLRCSRSRAIHPPCRHSPKSWSTSGAHCSARFLLLCAMVFAAPAIMPRKARCSRASTAVFPTRCGGRLDADHGRLWRRRSDDAARPDGRGYHDGGGAWLFRACRSAS